jgi:A/G-specific adenine glycosylase
MEFGALQCKPKSPVCPACPLQAGCFARKNNRVNELPVKEKKLRKRIRYFNYFFCTDEASNILIKKRGAGDIWQELYDFPLIETEDVDAERPLKFETAIKETFGDRSKITLLYRKKHLLTHQTIYVQFFALDNYIINFNQNADIKWVSLREFEQLPQPKVITDFMTAHSQTK